MILTPLTMSGEELFVPLEFLGPQGLFVAIIFGLLAARIYVLIIKNGWTIKLPAGVPPTVSRSFLNLTPGFIIAAIMAAINGAFSITVYGSVHDFVYTLIQTPLQNLGGSYWALVTVILTVHILWLFGIHGMLVIMPIYQGVWLPLGLENVSALAAGDPLPNIVSSAFFMTFVIIGGSGATLGICIYMAFRAKSERYKKLGKLALPGSFFGINEPLIFGMPIVLNPYLAIPFILSPLASGTIAYLVMNFGLVPIANGTPTPLGVPIIANAFIQGGFILIVTQIILLVVTAIIYYPFFKALDKKAVADEKNHDEAEES